MKGCPLRRERLRQRFQYELAYRLQSVEYAITGYCDCLEVWSLFDPFSTRKLVDEVLSGVIWIGSHARTRWIRRLPARIERGLQLADWSSVRKVALVVLNDERNTGDVVPVLGKVVIQVLHRLEVRFHSLDLRIGDEHH